MRACAETSLHEEKEVNGNQPPRAPGAPRNTIKKNPRNLGVLCVLGGERF
jgi:hypothetical protein